MSEAVKDALFDDLPAANAPPVPIVPDERLVQLGKHLPKTIRLGTFSWSFPGWRGIVYGPSSGEQRLAREGIGPYAAYPIFRTVSVERNFYKPLSVNEFAHLADNVPNDFRFIVKAPRAVTDPYLRSTSGRPTKKNPRYLNADEALSSFIGPVDAGLGDKAGPLVFQFSPYPHPELRRTNARVAVLEEMTAFFSALAERIRKASLHPRILAVEFRNYELLTPRAMMMMKNLELRPVVGLHPAMPGLRRQIAALRFCDADKRVETASPGKFLEEGSGSNKSSAAEAAANDWRLAGPLVACWPFAAHRFFDTAQRNWSPFDGICAADPATRALLASLVHRAAKSQVESYLVAGNKAEGSAPLTIRAIAELVERMSRNDAGR